MSYPVNQGQKARNALATAANNASEGHENALYCKARIPVYKATGIDGNTAYLYANSLKHFCL